MEQCCVVRWRRRARKTRPRASRPRWRAFTPNPPLLPFPTPNRDSRPAGRAQLTASSECVDMFPLASSPGPSLPDIFSRRGRKGLGVGVRGGRHTATRDLTRGAPAGRRGDGALRALSEPEETRAG
jgi:hypothetical protein